MNRGASRPDLTIFTGRFGSGKTEAAINYALSLATPPAPGTPGRTASGELPPPDGVVLMDLDIVTPYFRTRERTEMMRQRGVTVISPSAIGQHLDTPAITPQILGTIQQHDRPVVLDVGGDRQGARALGQFSAAIRQRGYTMHFVVNAYRPFTDTLEGLAASIGEIEASSRLQVSSLVSNPNLIGETTMEKILDGHAMIEDCARQLGLPIAFACVERRWIDSVGTGVFAQPVLILDRYFVMAWE
jgi:hypothetical protein